MINKNKGAKRHDLNLSFKTMLHKCTRYLLSFAREYFGDKFIVVNELIDEVSRLYQRS